MTAHGRVIDAQIHIWKASSPGRPWPADAIAPQREIPLEMPEVTSELGAAGVDGALLLAPTWDGGRNDYVLEASTADPEHYGALLRYDIADPSAAERLVDWRSWSGVRGIRLSLNRGDVAGRLTDGHRSGFFRMAEAAGIPLSIYAPHSLELYEDLARRFPGMKIAVDHAGLDSDVQPLVSAIEPLRRLAEYPGVAIKASALPCFVQEAFPFPSIGQAITRLIEWFGPERVFWGSDLSRLTVRYGDLVGALRDHTPDLGERQRSLLLGEALAAWTEWPKARSDYDGEPVSSHERGTK